MTSSAVNGLLSENTSSIRRFVFCQISTPLPKVRKAANFNELILLELQQWLLFLLSDVVDDNNNSKAKHLK
jgi:hypothetical protein